MGLMGKVAAKNGPVHSTDQSDSSDIQTVINNFYHDNPLFHCVILQFNSDQRQGASSVAAMVASHGAACLSLHGGNSLVLLPGRLDMELFSHRLSQSTDSAVLFQFSANSPSLALETLEPYLR